MPFSDWKDCFAKQTLSKAVLIPLFFFLCTTPLSLAYAATVNLAWDASTGSNIAGYKMYYGMSSGNYSYNVDVGNNKNCSLSGLQEGKKYYFAATAYNTGKVESAHSNEISHTVPISSSSGSTSTGSTSTSTPSGTSGSSNTIIIDNGKSGTKASGSWELSSAPGFYGSNSVWSSQSAATYSYEAASSGSQEVYIWYTQYSNRCTNVPVKIYNGSSLLKTLTVNQQQNGGKWNKLGTFSFGGKAKVITTSKGGCITSADAIKFVPTSATGGTTSSGTTSSGSTGSTTSSGSTSGSTPSSAIASTSTSTPSGTSGSSNTIIIDNGKSGTKASGSWGLSSAPGFYGSNSVWSSQSAATYTYEAASSGSQEVYIWYTQYSNRCTNVPVKIYNGSTHLDTVTVDQQKNGGRWNKLGTFNFSGKAKVITASNGGCITSADAIKFVPASSTSSTTSTGASASSGSIIVDNGDKGTVASGSWKVSSGPGFYGPNSIYSDRSSSTYLFEAACSGVQEVYLWWVNHANRCTNVPVEIYDGNIYLDTVEVNQQQNGGQWNELGTFSFGGKAKVKIISRGGCITSADAVNFFEPN